MNEHPQVQVFLHAAASMRENRYWARNPREQVAFLRARRNVMTEVCFHVDHNHVLDPRGLAAFAAASEVRGNMRWLGATAETVLLPELDEAIQLSLAVVESADNTGEDSTARPCGGGESTPPS